MPTVLNTQSREEIRAKVQGALGRRILMLRDLDNDAVLLQLPRMLRQRAQTAFHWAKAELRLVDSVVSDALKEDSLYFSIATPEEPSDPQAIISELHHQISVFQALDPRTAPGSFHKVLVVVFPKLEQAARGKITDLQREFGELGLEISGHRVEADPPATVAVVHPVQIRA